MSLLCGRWRTTCRGPVIFPLSNPTSRAEATPQHLLDWTRGRALIGVGSPFPCPTWDGGEVAICQTNNSYIFPGVGLGLIASGARRVTEAMFMAAARALAELSPTRTDKTAPLLPPVDQLREVAFAVAVAVAKQAQADGVAEPCDDANEVLASSYFRRSASAPALGAEPDTTSEAPWSAGSRPSGRTGLSGRSSPDPVIPESPRSGTRPGSTGRTICVSLRGSRLAVARLGCGRDDTFAKRKSN